jgi:hypothetical protein
VPSTQPGLESTAAPGRLARGKTFQDNDGPQPPRWKVWANRARLRWLESWSGSFALHLLMLLLLATWTLSRPQVDVPRMLTMVERPVEEATQRLDTQQVAAESFSFMPSVGAAAVSHSDAIEGVTGTPALDRAVASSGDEGIASLAVNLADVSLRTLPSEELTNSLGMQSPGDPSVVVKGAQGAIDKITQEIALMLAKGKVELVWLFDESASVQSMREDIRKRIDRIYEELKLTDAKQGDALVSAVASFGQTVHFHTRKPTANLETIRADIEQIPNDPSGLENMCAAIQEAIARHQKGTQPARRQMALIVVTDESGDDGDRIEATIQAARAANCRVYVMGIEAAFGNRVVYRTWTDEQAKLSFWLETHLGPETALDEQLQTDGLWTRRDCQSSGFGPYEQVRLCRETGGVFFIVKEGFDANTVGAMFAQYDNEAMRPYLPDLDPRLTLQEKRQREPLRQLLGMVIDKLNPRNDGNLNLRDRFALKPDEFVKQALEQQRKVPFLMAAYDEAEKRLDSLRRQREQETSARWQANYDLLYAQTLCYKVRVYEYAAFLEMFLQQPRPVTKPDTTYWIMTTRSETVTGETTQGYVDRSRALFEKVIADHPNTPYALRAQWELGRGYGVQLVEDNWDPRHETYDHSKLPKL